jgi:ribonuclease-3
MKENLRELERAIGHTFQNTRYLETAVTHSSFANERGKGVANNERQEFLGDAVLSIVVSDYLFKRFLLAEGDLTKLRASLVCEKSLCGFAGELGLGNYLLLGKGEGMTGGAKRPSILADAFEAVIAAIYLDGGFDAAASFVIPFVERALDGELEIGFRDYKTELQEIVQRNPDESVHYMLVDESGPDHDKCFEVEALLHSNVLGRGIGRSKKAAEQAAAKEVLRLMGEL